MAVLVEHVAVGLDDLVHAQERGGVGAVLAGHAPVVGAADVVLGSGAADGGEFLVTVHEELDLTFAPPAVVQHAPAERGADVVAAAADAVDDGVFLAVPHGVGAAVLSVEIGGIVGDVREGVVDLVEASLRLSRVLVFERDAAVPPERHLPEAVESAAGIDGDWQRGDLGKVVFQVVLPGRPRHGKEVG